jgi:hypothetical protein
MASNTAHARVCAPPVPSCAQGAFAKFDAGTETWSCTTTCDASYDLDMYNGSEVCVPC